MAEWWNVPRDPLILGNLKTVQSCKTRVYIYIYDNDNKYILDNDIYLIHGKYSVTLGFMKLFCKTTIIRQLRRWNEM